MYPPASKVEIQCVDLLCRQQHIVNELIESEDRPSEEITLDHALKTLCVFLDFADEHFDDHEAIALAERVREIGDRTERLRANLVSGASGPWKRILTQSPQNEYEVRTEYLQLGKDYVELHRVVLEKCWSLCPVASPLRQGLWESTELLLAELHAKW